MHSLFRGLRGFGMFKMLIIISTEPPPPPPPHTHTHTKKKHDVKHYACTFIMSNMVDIYNIDKQQALRRDCIYNIENTDLEIGVSGVSYIYYIIF